MSNDGSSSGRVPDPGIRALYTLDNRWQSRLDVEAALAHAQEELGIVPTGTAAAIERHARLELLDRTRIDAATARTGHPIVPLVWELARVIGEPAGGWVHWGATTQNIIQTGDLLVLRQAHTIFRDLIKRMLLALADLAERGAKVLMAGRTHGQHAIPITFGFKIAVWIDEILRHCERLRQSEPRIFVAMLGGAAGTFASLGELGPAVQAGIARRLGMSSMTIPARTTIDHLAEYVLLLGFLGATCGKIGREIYTLMKTEFGEAEEPVPEGSVGSSTMPQKRNPHICQEVIAGAAELRPLRAARAGGDTGRARGRPLQQPDDPRRHRPRLHRNGRRSDPARDHPGGIAVRPGSDAPQPGQWRRADHGRSGNAGTRPRHRPPACA